MKKDVLITIKGIQYQDDEPDTVELTTVGRFYKKDNSYYICYDESEATGFEGSKTTLKVEGEGKVTMLRRGGKNSSQLIIEKGARHQCLYDTEYGSLTLGVSGDRIISRLGDDGGDLNFRYTLDINASMATENEVIISVRECSRS
ncbi:MAG: DUF1934 domain-containing protein [Oscillospiraceae bacterium]|nr:DUF1934 domain-containing protein [Oscillospiraceae bacterium]MDY4192214.1 DUF1934 domain-containing protein [Oscillospiraceae bacterium]